MFGIEQMVSGIFDTANTVYNVKQTKELNEDTQQFANDQSIKQRKWDLKMWNLQNAYNSPIEQMKRLEAAGLNKNLMFGQGTTGNAAGRPTYEQAKWNPNVPRSDINIDGSNILGEVLKYQDIRMRDAQISNQDKIGRNLDLQNVSKGIENTIKGRVAEYQLQNIRAELNLKNQRALESIKKQGLTEQQTKLSETQGDALDAQINLNKQELVNRSIMENILRNQQVYDKFKQDFINENRYSPESSPTMWRWIQDGINRLRNEYYQLLEDSAPFKDYK